MKQNRKRKRQPGDVFRKDGCLVRIDQSGEEQPFESPPHELFPEESPPQPLNVPRRADGSIAPFYTLDQDELERLGQDSPRGRRVRHDGWTIERQKDFIERLASSASVTDAARSVGMTRQSARDLYNRSAHFSAAWDEAMRASVSVLAETAFERAVNGVQEQVWHNGEMVGFREKHDNRLLMFLLRVRDPLNFAPLDDLQGWQHHRALENGSAGIGPALDRLEAAEKAWAASQTEPPSLPAPADLLDPAASALSNLTPRSLATSSTSSPEPAEEGPP
jgi:hypothetical protein